jgi:predicted NBD/HSP70 family sugar kinase
MQHSRAGIRRRTDTEAGPSPATRTGRSPVQIADHNLRVTLEAIRRDGPLTRLELARRSGLTAPGITNILRRLENDGLVTARKRTSAGQPSMEFALNPDGAFAIGVRLHRANGEAVLVDLSGRVRDTIRFEPGSDPAATIRTIVDQLSSGPAASRIIGVGIGMDGPAAVDLAALNAALAPLRVWIERDCVTAVLAERTLGLGIVEGGMMMIILDDRVRAGLLLQGMPFGGVHGRAGSIGAMRTGADHVPLDSVVGLGTLRALLTDEERLALASGKDLPLTPVIHEWLQRAAGHLLDALVATAGLLAPGAILIGGELPRNLVEALIAQMSVERRDTAIRPFATPSWMWPIRQASFSSAGIAVGAALLPFFDLLLPSPMATA